MYLPSHVMEMSNIIKTSYVASEKDLTSATNNEYRFSIPYPSIPSGMKLVSCTMQLDTLIQHADKYSMLEEDSFVQITYKAVSEAHCSVTSVPQTLHPRDKKVREELCFWMYPVCIDIEKNPSNNHLVNTISICLYNPSQDQELPLPDNCDLPLFTFVFNFYFIVSKLPSV